MARAAELLEVIKFFQVHKNVGLYSTSAKKIYVTSDVYNVSGSTADPKIGGKSWKQLLISNGINDDCYVTNHAPPSGTSHADFSVGGHVTKNSDGKVKTGDISYLMPLCYWHNSTRRDGKAFKHTQTEMLKLEGFMKGDTGITFMARISDGEDEPSRIIFETDDGWDFKKMDNIERQTLLENKVFQLFDTADRVSYFVINRNDADGRFYVDFASDDLSDLL